MSAKASRSPLTLSGVAVGITGHGGAFPAPELAPEPAATSTKETSDSRTDNTQQQQIPETSPLSETATTTPSAEIPAPSEPQESAVSATTTAPTPEALPAQSTTTPAE